MPDAYSSIVYTGKMVQKAPAVVFKFSTAGVFRDCDTQSQPSPVPREVTPDAGGLLCDAAQMIYHEVQELGPTAVLRGAGVAPGDADGERR